MKKVSLRTALKALGCKNIKLTKNGSVYGYTCYNAYFAGGGKYGFDDGQCYVAQYFPIVAKVYEPSVVYYKSNNWKESFTDFNAKLEKLDMYVPAYMQPSHDCVMGKM